MAIGAVILSVVFALAAALWASFALGTGAALGLLIYTAVGTMSLATAAATVEVGPETRRL